jgi:hypothetical protein
MPSNSEIREWYLEQVSRIDLEDAKLELAGVSVAERARRAYDARLAARQQARRMMGDSKELEVLRRRDLAKYGKEDGPTFEQLLEKHSRRGLPDDAAYKAIIRSASRTNTSPGKMFGAG